MNYFEESLKLHEKNAGKIEVNSKIKITTREEWALARVLLKGERLTPCAWG